MSNDVHQWVHDNVPLELLNSTLFVFNVSLGQPIGKICRPCNALWPVSVQKCSQCNNEDLEDHFKTLEVKIFPDVNLDYNIVQLQLEQIPSQFAWWACVDAEAKLYVNTLEKQLKVMKAIVEHEVAQLGAKITVPHMKSLVEKDTRVIGIELKYQAAVASREKIALVVEALRMKSDLARSLNSLKKQELEKY